MTLPPHTNELTRLKKFVEIGDSGCWQWTGYRDRNGYGCVTMAGKRWFAHRASYSLVVGPIPDGKVLHHHCRNPSCANPLHLECITAIENTLRNVSPPSCNRRKTSCEHGHPFDEVNTYRHGKRRQCRKCNTEAVRKYKTRQKLEGGSTDG